MKQIIDNFSSESKNYATFRPESPQELFDFLFEKTKHFEVAWDCGTGNGQVAMVLAGRFGSVIATDISEEQLKHASPKTGVDYRLERAEKTSIAEKSVDLITVAQAIHWFDYDYFYKEVMRVAKPGCLLAVWTYNLVLVSPEVDRVIHHLYADITGPYWDKERRYIDEEYKTIPFPFAEIAHPEFQIVKSWTLEQLTGYLETWSGVKNYMKAGHMNPVTAIAENLKRAWGNDETKQIIWPLHVRAGYI